MSDIAFSFSADEKDILRALESTGKSFAQVRDQVTKLAIASREHGTAELSISKQRAEALAPLVAKQKELRAIGESPRSADEGREDHGRRVQGEVRGIGK